MEGLSEADRGAGLDCAEIQEVIRAVRGEETDGVPVDIEWNGAHSNDICQIRFGDGRVLMMKRARHAWGRQAFRASSAAARILREQADILVPEPLSLPDTNGLPRQAYWRIPDPTLADVWPSLAAGARRSAMRSLGRLLVDVHAVRLPAWGAVAGGERRGEALAEVVGADLVDRLLPAFHGLLPDAAAAVERLSSFVDAVGERAEQRGPTLAHNDLHMGNVLCRVEGDEVTCVGLLDLDEAVAAPPASDVARFEVLHGPLFAQHLSPRWRAEVWRGYGRRPEAFLVVFFRALHLANLGLHSAIVGDDAHAELVARALKQEVVKLERTS